MQTGTTTTTSSKTSKSKALPKPRGTAKSPTLRLKDKQSAAALYSGDVESLIATVAYFRAEQRGFEPGHELEDWLYAEQHVHQLTS